MSNKQKTGEFMEKKCAACKGMLENKRTNLCLKCRSDVALQMADRKRQDNPTENEIDRINNEMNFHNTVYTKTGEY